MNPKTTARKLREAAGEQPRPDVRVRFALPESFLKELQSILSDQQKALLASLADRDAATAVAIGEERNKLLALQSELLKAIREKRVERVEVLNLPKPQPAPVLPESIAVKKPSWYQRFVPDSILKALKQTGDAISGSFADALNRHTKKENAFAVRLVTRDGKDFYTAFFQSYSSAIPSALSVNNFPADYPDAAAEASLAIIDDWDETDRAKVNPIAGQAGVQGGAGTVTALTQRVAIATDANDVDVLTQPVRAATTDAITAKLATDAIQNGLTALTPKFAFANVAASTTDGNIVTAVASKKIRVLAVAAVAGATATNLTFNSKPGGAGAAISPLFANAANGGEILPFSPVGWFETVSGEGLAVTTGAGSTTGILVTYVEV